MDFGFARDGLTMKNESDMNIWLTRGVAKVERLKKLEIMHCSDSVSIPDNLVKYSTYKYPILNHSRLVD